MSEPTTEPALEVAAQPALLPKLREWIIHHDDSWLFTLSYITAAVVLSIWISLFWLVVVVGVHLAFEWVRQQHHDPRWPGVGQRVAWELKLDLALILLALALAVYMELILGVAGLGAASRLGVQGGARAVGWSKALRGVLLSLDDAAQLARAVGSGALGRRGGDGEEGQGEPFDRYPWRRWGFGDHLAIWLAIACLALILTAPLLVERQSYAGVWETLLSELRPLPAVEAPP